MGADVLSRDWSGWRGPDRDGRVPWLPASLAAKPKIVWEKPLADKGLGGVAATRDLVIVSDRELNNTLDVYKCLRASDGEELWSLRHPAPGELDFGSSPRATPLIQGDLVFLFGAFGHLHCVDLKTGESHWQKDIRAEFGVDEKLTWGYCGTPLLVDGKLIVSPGAPLASIVALEARTGKVLWKSPGVAASYGSFNVLTLGGKKQIVGYDHESLGGWDISTGKRLWRLKPPRDNDYNIATPMRFEDKLMVCTENNGTRLYRFDTQGRIIPEPVAVSTDYAPETQTPVMIGNRLFGAWKEFYCLDLKNGLKTLWSSDDPAFADHVNMFAGSDRLLVSTMEGELLLIDANADRFKLLGRTRVFEDERGLYSHPALVGNRLYWRGGSKIVCLELAP